MLQQVWVLIRFNMIFNMVKFQVLRSTHLLSVKNTMNCFVINGGGERPSYWDPRFHIDVHKRVPFFTGAPGVWPLFSLFSCALFLLLFPLWNSQIAGKILLFYVFYQYKRMRSISCSFWKKYDFCLWPFYYLMSKNSS